MAANKVAVKVDERAVRVAQTAHIAIWCVALVAMFTWGAHHDHRSNMIVGAASLLSLLVFGIRGIFNSRANDWR